MGRNPRSAGSSFAGTGIVLALYQAYDQGSGEFWDVSEFTPLSDDPDDDVEHEFPALDDALEFARIHCGADPGRYVNAGVLAEEYRDYFVRRDAQGDSGVSPAR